MAGRSDQEHDPSEVALPQQAGEFAPERDDEFEPEIMVSEAIKRGRLPELAHLVLEAILPPSSSVRPPNQADHPPRSSEEDRLLSLPGDQLKHILVSFIRKSSHEAEIPGREPRSQGGEMGRQESGQSPAGTPQSRLSREWETFVAFCENAPEEDLGKHVLIQGSQVLGTFPSRNAALKEGYQRVGLIPFLVQEITREETIGYLPPYIA